MAFATTHQAGSDPEELSLLKYGLAAAVIPAAFARSFFTALLRRALAVAFFFSHFYLLS